MDDVMPMFPLGTVLLPGMVLPLHVFEPRYRQLMRDIGPRGRFGVVLIERGSEVGGGDARTDVGTIAQLLDSQELEDGRWVTVSVGVQRFAVREWLDDDPYPRALVEVRPDDPGPIDLSELVARFHRVMELATQLEDEVVQADLSDDPVQAVYQAAILAPLGPVDRLALLRCETVAERAEALLEQLAGVEEILRFRLDTI